MGRMQARDRVRAGRLASLAIAAGTAFLAAGCTSPATPFPSVFNDPPRHEDAPLAPNEVKQALDNLVSDRNHLCAQATDPVATGTAATNPAAGNTQQCGEASGATPAGDPVKPR